MRQILVITILLGSFCSRSQQISELSLKGMSLDGSSTNYIRLRTEYQVPSSLFFDRYRQVLVLSEDMSFSQIQSQIGLSGHLHEKFQQQYRGIDIEGVQCVLNSNDGMVICSMGNILKELNLDIISKLTAAAAIEIALSETKITLAYENPIAVQQWKSLYKREIEQLLPHAELVISNANQTFSENPEDYKLCWKVKLIGAQFFQIQYVFIDAQSEEVIDIQQLGNQCESGTGETTWNGNFDLKTMLNGNEYILNEQCPDNVDVGNVHTMNNSTGTPMEYNDIDNAWTNQYSGVSAHVFARGTLDFFNLYFNRNSYDNDNAPLLVLCEESDLPNTPNINEAQNAYWDSNGAIHFGNNNTNAAADDFNTIDIVGHEIGHAVVQSMAGLSNTNISGALNEGFADIFGVAVERHFLGVDYYDWKIGEDRSSNPMWVRNLSNPNEGGNHYEDCVGSSFTTQTVGIPDTYEGDFWHTCNLDNGGVHINCGVLGYWFYVLSMGDADDNDNGFVYDVAGIGFNDAIGIVYEALSQLTTYSNYGDAKNASIQAAIDLFDENSIQHQTVIAAWCAVGMGNDCDSQSCSAPSTPSSISPGTTLYPGTYISDATPTFQWQASTGAIGYRLSISKYPFGVQNIVFTQCFANTETQYTLTSPLDENDYYRWDVQAIIDCSDCVSSYSADRYFNTIPTEDPIPNLSYYSIACDFVNENANWNLTIGNNSLGEAGPFAVNFFLCNDLACQSSIPLGSAFIPTGINEGGEESISYTYDLCSLGVADGTYFLGCEIDPLNDIVETSDQDNFYVSELDHQLECSTNTPNGNISYGTSIVMISVSSITLSYVMDFIGTEPTGPFTVKYFLSPTQNFSDAIVIQEDNFGSIQPSIPLFPSFFAEVCDIDLPNGEYYFGYFIDWDNDVIETLEYTDNMFIYLDEPLIKNCIASLPNLGFVQVTQNQFGNLLNLNYWIINSGALACPPFNVNLLISQSSMFTDYSVFQIDEYETSLLPNAQYSGMSSLDLCSPEFNLANDNYYIKLWLDFEGMMGNGEISESDEFDNDWSGGINAVEVNCSAENIESVNLENSVEIFPNPSSGLFSLTSQMPQSGQSLIEIFDCQGRIQFSNSTYIQGRKPLMLDMKGRSKGIYLLKISNGDSIITKKLIVE
jgi:bacillolysin